MSTEIGTFGQPVALRLLELLAALNASPSLLLHFSLVPTSGEFVFRRARS